MGKFLCFFLCCLVLDLLIAVSTVVAQPLSTDSRWIVDESGQRVKLSCVNWPSHLDVVVAEGLSKQPVDEISEEIRSLGFNCVRLTWPLFLFTNDTLAALTVRQSLTNLGLFEAVAGFQTNNPDIIDLSLIDAYQAVVGSLGKKNVMIILDNHTSKPGWCCGDADGNGFFGDEYFNPDVWVKGLTRVATTFKATKNVVGMSLRNELRGRRQNVYDWYRYMQKGAEAVHSANPNVLVILSGLKYDRDLSFLLNKPVTLTFSKKLVYELHWYGFSNGQAWATGNPNQVCGQLVADTATKAGFLLDQGYPLFVSEFGVDMRGTNVNDNRNQTTLHKISALQYPFRGPGYLERRPHKILFHPMTGLCVKRLSLVEPLVLGPCSEAEAWSYTPQQTLTIKGTYFCLQADALGHPAKLGLICTDATSKWQAVSDSKMHLSSKLEDGTNVCLDVDSDNNVVTNNCKCLDNKNNKCDPASQWFKLIDSTRCGADKSFFLEINSILKLVANSFLTSFGL
ncbi:UNVERIFIED_CONTAM: Glycosyl hydrolase 5 family protein [Sesamum radiatum]|uniref:Glycosyl hydrolase 5 family protein n=1 Tax=Sesamum radiatum TaxID=300843 RepID=A0AAW2RYW1_SESRA